MGDGTSGDWGHGGGVGHCQNSWAHDSYVWGAPRSGALQRQRRLLPLPIGAGGELPRPALAPPPVFRATVSGAGGPYRGSSPPGCTPPPTCSGDGIDGGTVGCERGGAVQYRGRLRGAGGVCRATGAVCGEGREGRGGGKGRVSDCRGWLSSRTTPQAVPRGRREPYI